MKSKHWILLLTSLLFFLFNIPRAVMYSDNQLAGWAVYGLIFGLLPFLVHRTVSSAYPNSSWSVGLAALSVLIIGPSFGLLQGHRERDELNDNGAWTKAVVIEKKYTTHRGSGSWCIKCTFKANGIIYETPFNDLGNHLYNIGDTLRVIYSREFPKINEVEYQWQ